MPQKLIQHSLGFSRETRMDSIMRSSKAIMFNTRTKNQQLSNLHDFKMKKLDNNEQLVLIQTNRSVNNERDCLSKMLALRKIYERHSFDKYDPVLHPQKRNRLCHLDARDLMKMWFKGKTVKIDHTESDIRSQTDSRPVSSIFQRMRLTSGRSRKMSSVSGEGGVWGNIITETIHEEAKDDTDSLLDENTQEVVVHRLDDERVHIAPIQPESNEGFGKNGEYLTDSKIIPEQSEGHEATGLKMQTSEVLKTNESLDTTLENKQSNEEHNKNSMTKEGKEVNNLDQNSSENNKLPDDKNVNSEDAKITDIENKLKEEQILVKSRASSQTRKPLAEKVGQHGKNESLGENIPENARLNETTIPTQSETYGEDHPENTIKRSLSDKRDNSKSSSVITDQTDMKQSTDIDTSGERHPNLPANDKRPYVQNTKTQEKTLIHSDGQNTRKITVSRSSAADNDEQPKLKDDAMVIKDKTDTQTSADVKTRNGRYSDVVVCDEFHDDKKDIKTGQQSKVLHQRQSSSKSNVLRESIVLTEKHSETNKIEITNSRNTLCRKQMNNTTSKSENVRASRQKFKDFHTQFAREKTVSGVVRTSKSGPLRNQIVRNEVEQQPSKERISASSSNLNKQQTHTTRTINKLQPSTAPSILKRNKTEIESWMSSVNNDTRRSSSASTLRIDRKVIQNAATNYNPTNWKGLIHKLRGQHTAAIVDDRVIAAKSMRRLKRREKTFVLSRERTIFPGECKSTYEMRKFMDREVSSLIFSLSPKGRRQNQIELLKEREKLPVFVDKSKTTSAILRDYRKYREIVRTVTAP